MYCKKCGKEISDNTIFCGYCGAMQEMRSVNVPSPQERTQKDEKKTAKKGGGKHVKGIAIAAVLAVVIGAGALIYLGSPGYKCRENIESARAYLEQGEYEDALECCEAAMKLDKEYAEAYLTEADIYVTMDNYQDAVDILERGMKNISSGKSLEECEEKLEDVYRTEAKRLVGIWRIDYNMAGMIANMIPQEAVEKLKNSLGLDLNKELNSINAEVPILLEVKESGVLRLSVDGEFFEGAGTGLSTVVKAIGSLYATPVVGNIAGKVTKALMDLLVNNVGINYTCEVREGTLYCTGADSRESAYAFAINGNTLRITGSLSSDAEASYLSFPLVLERVE